MERFEVWSLVDGAHDATLEQYTLEAAEACALQWSRELTRAGVADWAVYILPHYCDESDECTCAQWLQDHHPAHSSVPA